jgi:hypothetical protein
VSLTSVLAHPVPRAAAPVPPEPRGSRLASVLTTALGTTLAGFCLSVLLLGGAADLTGVEPTARPVMESGTTRATPHEARLLRRYHCSTDGLAPTAIPGSALVRDPDGRVHAVSFDRGWQVFRQHGPRTLVAVCLRPLG